MKPKKKYVNYKQEMIKQGLEPDTFRMLIKRIISDNPAISVPQAILAGLQDENRRDLIATRKKDDLKENRGDLPKNDIDSKAVNQILNEIREYQARIKDLCDQVDKGVLALESLVNNKDTGEGNDSKRG